ncbi:coiled-coil domain-containing protein [Bdellovibrio reynosensis]|uniref:Uncharacterized protein n=1 Tax=Bdellovibrio reynosensis TaxID=2835041 RepID=A0ABY4CE29_9BACT|nr:hypothetical protein [Bdellovibrio reynosensis]UOF02006.1 hypothetical protein MNR06_03440 [Bdellovibrio reynosensis]
MGQEILKKLYAGSFAVIVILTFVGCDQKLHSGKMLDLESAQAAIVAASSNQLPYLSDKEKDLSTNSSYRSIHTAVKKYDGSFNCIPDQNNECPQSIELRNILYSGQVVIVDANKSPWNVLHSARDLKNLKIEADKIIVRTRVHFPSTHLRLIADEIIFEENGKIDLTPIALGEGHSSKEAIDGAAGSNVFLHTKSFKVLGAQNARIIIRGGQGQNARKGTGQTQEEINKFGRLRAKSIVPITDAAVPKQFLSHASSIIFSAEHRTLGRDLCKYTGPKNDPILSCKTLIDIVKALGLEGVTPDDGKDATAGGLPGAGGAGGNLFLSAESKNIPNIYFDLTVGNNGLGDPERFGSLAGTPNPYYKISWRKVPTHRDDFKEDVPELNGPYYKKDGASVLSPSQPDHQNQGGRVRSEQSPSFYFSRIYFELNLARIKEAYLKNNFEEAAVLLKAFKEKLKNAENHPDYLTVKLSAQKINNSLLAQKDYFGRGLNDVPKFTFSFNAALYKAEVDRAIRSYYLASIFKKSLKTKEEKEAAAKSAMEAVEANLATTLKEISHAQQKFTNLSSNLDLAQKKEAYLAAYLENINKQIEEKAKQNVISRQRADQFKNFLKSAAAIAKVIPYAQPALGVTAGLLETVWSGPDAMTLEGFVAHYEEIRGHLDGFENKAKFNESKADWIKFKDKFDHSKLDGLTIEEKFDHYSRLQKDLYDTAKKIEKADIPLKQPQFPQSEIEQEIAKLRVSDPVLAPMFNQLTSLLEDLMQTKLQIQKDHVEYSNLVEKLFTHTNDLVKASGLISKKYLDGEWNFDGTLPRFAENAARDAEERLIYLFSELTRSYKYLTLQEYQSKQADSLKALREKLQVELDKTDTEVAIALLKDFYFAQIQSLIGELTTNLLKSNHGITLATTAPLTLNSEQLAVLNHYGYVDILLPESKYQYYKNVRIFDVDVLEHEVEFSKVEDGVSIRPTLFMDFQLAEKGTINDGSQIHTFYYPRNVNLFRWDFQFKSTRNGSVEMSKSKLSDETKGILGNLITDGSVVSKASVFSSHAGVTTVRIRISNDLEVADRSAVKVKYLRASLSYSYTQ